MFAELTKALGSSLVMRRTPLYLVRLGETGVEVIDTYEIAYGFYEVAVELWQLAGRADRARAIANVFTSAYELEPPQLEDERLRMLRGLLDGLEPALIGTLTDEHHMLTQAQVEELRGRTTTLELDEAVWGDRRWAVQEALCYVDHLRNIVARALELDAVILFD
jgi:hypothetical protein